VTIYSELAIALCSAYVVWRYTGFIPSFKIIAKTSAASIIMWLCLYFIPTNFYYSWFGLIIGGLIAIMVYFISLYGLKGVTKDDLKILLNKKL